MVMKLLLLLSCLTECIVGLRLHLGSCTVNAHTHELRKHYAEIRQSAREADSHMEVRFLRAEVMRNVPEGETCCLVRLLLRFFVERVFSSHALLAQPQYRRPISTLANGFLSIKRDLRLCQCHCGDNTRARLDALHTEFDQLGVQAAAVKALGELDSVLDWLEGLNPHTV